MLTYESQAAKDADKALLDLAREALDITPSALQLDECGLWFYVAREAGLRRGAMERAISWLFMPDREWHGLTPKRG